MDRRQKKELVSSMSESFEKMNLIVVAHYSGLTVSEVNELRGQMRDAGASFHVTKNSLVRLAVMGTKFEGLRDMFSGPTAIALSIDPVAAAKVAIKFSKQNEKLVVLGGGLGAEPVVLAASLPALALLVAQRLAVPEPGRTRGVVGVPVAGAAAVADIFDDFEVELSADIFDVFEFELSADIDLEPDIIVLK